MEQAIYTEKDIETALRIFNRAIEFFKIPDEPTNEQAKEYITDGKLDFEKIPALTIKTWETGEKFINLVYFYDGFFTVYADYNPVIAILGFLDEARKLLKSKFPQADEAKIEEWTEFEASKMALSLISRIHQRMDLAMRNYTDEVIHNWIIEWLKWEKKVNSEHGIKSPPFGEKKIFRNLLKTYEEEVFNLWFNIPNINAEERNKQLAADYPSLLRHWKKLRKEYTDGNPDWREYAKGGKFIDTPNDLIDLLEDCRDMSHLALEHAARRAGLVNPDMKTEDLEKRQLGINVTGYSARQLNNFKKEGDKLLNETKN